MTGDGGTRWLSGTPGARLQVTRPIARRTPCVCVRTSIRSGINTVCVSCPSAAAGSSTFMTAPRRPNPDLCTTTSSCSLCRGVSRECLHARFAFATLSNKTVFTKLSHVPLSLILLGDDEQPQTVVLPFSGYAKRFVPPARSGSRSTSPQKRLRSGDNFADRDTGGRSSDDGYGEWEAQQWGESPGNSTLVEVNHDDECRGRSQKWQRRLSSVSDKRHLTSPSPSPSSASLGAPTPSAQRDRLST